MGEKRGVGQQDVFMGKAIYQKMLAKGELAESLQSLEKHAKEYFQERGLSLESLNEIQCQRASSLKGLYLAKCKGNKSWQGLVIGFPGTKEQLGTAAVGTPYMRRILYPILKCFEETQKDYHSPTQCIYILGEAFSDVWLRKFRFLRYLAPHVVVISEALKRSSFQKHNMAKNISQKAEAEFYYQNRLALLMGDRKGFAIEVAGGKKMTLRFLGREVPTGEGTKNPERLDLLAYDKGDKALVAFEIKGPKASRAENENLFFQAMEHRDWLEKNKMAIKFVFDKGPKGRNINIRKRVKLVLGYFDEKILNQVKEMAKVLKKDKYISVETCDLKMLGTSHSK